MTDTLFEQPQPTGEQAETEKWDFDGSVYVDPTEINSVNCTELVKKMIVFGLMDENDLPKQYVPSRQIIDDLVAKVLK